jgi:hypothetical protein
MCTHLRELEIDIWITVDGRARDFFADIGKETWTLDDHWDWKDLGTFYVQLGSLIHLEVSNLKARVRIYGDFGSREL